jgi:hypothetical protein
MYWQRLGLLPYNLVLQKICGGNATALNSLIENEIIKVFDGMICIDFLNEQLENFDNLSKTNSQNAREGWEKRRKDATAKRPQSEPNAIREEESREKKIRVKEIKETNSLASIPEFDEFLNYALEHKPKVNTELLKLKYESWKANGWKTGGSKPKPIKNWKSTLLNTLPYIEENNTPTNPQEATLLAREITMRNMGLG